MPGRSAARPAEGDDCFGAFDARLATVIAGARRRAQRDGDRQIDTAHLLHSLLEWDPEARAALGGERQIARVLGYLVQRSIGYGLRWQGSVEDSGALPVVNAAADGRGCPGWSPAATAAMRAAGERARLRKAGYADGVDLLVGLAADPECRAVEVLGRAGVDAAQLT
ncbi:Clp protease N-terminal domain-containing protein [Streptomyces sp. HNM0663]|uniref:Clp protease N-terminal domain-containing protein n=1 Tax=Streptomyces chengmaiensis TaxID=3040919 RepID=A0ABT6HN65_9ACTN|nr:Clp protease N-terminal domain-containing protein [Streptomyces chengmaiensis]MDH2390164.1 Clp protease N-terminal domain-containing protein [Streptomyces chengmaiensis]